MDYGYHMQNCETCECRYVTTSLRATIQLNYNIFFLNTRLDNLKCVTSTITIFSCGRKKFSRMDLPPVLNEVSVKIRFFFRVTHPHAKIAIFICGRFSSPGTPIQPPPACPRPAAIVSAVVGDGSRRPRLGYHCRHRRRRRHGG